jgi:hypothetical protein
MSKFQEEELVKMKSLNGQWKFGTIWSVNENQFLYRVLTKGDIITATEDEIYKTAQIGDVLIFKGRKELIYRLVMDTCCNDLRLVDLNDHTIVTKNAPLDIMFKNGEYEIVKK